MDNSQFPLSLLPQSQRFVGLVVGGYGFFNVIRYLIYHDIPPLVFGRTPMPFSSAASFVLVGLFMYWAGVWNRGQATLINEMRKEITVLKPKRRTLADSTLPVPVAPAFNWADLLTPANLPKTVAAVGSLAVIITTIITAIKH